MTLSVDAYYGTQNRAKKLSLMNSDQLSKFWGYTGTTGTDFNNWVTLILQVANLRTSLQV